MRARSMRFVSSFRSGPKPEASFTGGPPNRPGTPCTSLRHDTNSASMERGILFGGILLLVALAFQTWVTVRVFRSRLYEPAQKSAQAKLIWLLPVLGAIIAFSVLTTEEQAERRYQNTDRELRG